MSCHTPRGEGGTPTGTWLVIYRPDTKPLQVISVLHAGRDVSNILAGRIA